MDIPKIPKIKTTPSMGGAKQYPLDERVRTTREEVLAGVDEGGKLYHNTVEDYALGPRNLRYSVETLQALKAEGVVKTYDMFDKEWASIDAFVEEVREANTDPDREEDANTVRAHVVWRRP